MSITLLCVPLLWHVQVQDSKKRLETEVSEWDLERKKAYFEGFKDHPLLDILGQSGSDPAAKMMALTSMSGEQIDELMTLLVVIAQQDSGELIASLREQVAKENEAAAPGTSSALNQVLLWSHLCFYYCLFD